MSKCVSNRDAFLFFEVTALPEFKEKPKMGAPKTKRREKKLAPKRSIS